MSEAKEQATVDLSKGVAASALTDGGMILGRVGDEEVVLARSGAELFAIGAHCSHYRGPLAEGLVVGDTVRCPWHHACFSLRTGEALRAPALDPIACWRVEREGDRIFVREKLPKAQPAPASAPGRRAALVGRHRRRRSGGRGRRRDAETQGLRRSAHDDQCRCRSARRSSEPVQGLPGRRGAGRLDSAVAE